jgi:hypothetical protein
LNCIKRYENFYSEDERHSQLSDDHYLDRGTDHVTDLRKTNSVQNGYENNLSGLKRASSFTNYRKIMFDDIRSTSYCTKTLSTMTESYLLKSKNLRLNNAGLEMKESTLKESTLKDESVDSISMNSNTQETKNPNPYDEITHYAETNSIDRVKSKKIESSLVFNLNN